MLEIRRTSAWAIRGSISRQNLLYNQTHLFCEYPMLVLKLLSLEWDSREHASCNY
jgi:hypothetical protein